jgi:hypothetical protein
MILYCKYTCHSSYTSGTHVILIVEDTKMQLHQQNKTALEELAFMGSKPAMAD